MCEAIGSAAVSAATAYATKQSDVCTCNVFAAIGSTAVSDAFGSASMPLAGSSYMCAIGSGAVPVTSGNMSDAFGSTALSLCTMCVSSPGNVSGVSGAPVPTHYVSMWSNRCMPASHCTGWRRCNGSTGAAVCRRSASARTATNTVVLSDQRAVLLPADDTAGLPAGDSVQLPDPPTVLLPADDATGLVPADGAAVPLPDDSGLPAADDSGLPTSVDARIDSMWMGTTAWRTWTA